MVKIAQPAMASVPPSILKFRFFFIAIYGALLYLLVFQNGPAQKILAGVLKPCLAHTSKPFTLHSCRSDWDGLVQNGW